MKLSLSRSLLISFLFTAIPNAFAVEWTSDTLLTVKPQDLSKNEVTDYLSVQTHGLISGANSSSTKFSTPLISSISFRVNPDQKAFEPNAVVSPDVLDQQFTFDIASFTQSMHQKDFLKAKIAYYQKLSFNTSLQTYSREYLYPTSWKDLFFPPQHTLTLSNQEYDDRFVPRSALPTDSAYFSPEWHKSVDAKTNTRLTFGNELQILSNDLSFQKKLDLISKAQKSIYVTVMSFSCDASSIQLLDAMAARVKAGVDVRITMEEIYADTIYTACVKQMKDDGIEVILANDTLKLGDQQGLLHNKFWIFDNNEAIIGGENIISADGSSTGFNNNSRDVDVHVLGPAATEIMGAYINLYDRFTSDAADQFRGVAALRAAVADRTAKETAARQRGQENYDAILNSPDTRMKGVCRFVIQGPEGDGNKRRVSQVFTEYLNQSQQSLYLTTPDLSFEQGDVKNPGGDTLIWNAVQAAAKRGVQVDVISNGIDGENGALGSSLEDLADQVQKNGHILLANAIRATSQLLGIPAANSTRKLLQVLAQNPTVRSWSFFQYYHGKTVMFDRKALAIGSLNLDNMSSNHNHESTLICQDEALLEQQEPIILRDLVNSVPVLQD